MTTERGTGREQINKSLPKEIQNALGETKYEIQREDFRKMDEKKHKKLKKKTKILKLLKNQMIPHRVRSANQNQRYEFFKSRKNH